MKHIPSETTANILSLLDAGLSAHAISSSTRISVGTISNIRSQHRPDLPKSSGGRPNLLSPYDLRHCTRLIQSGGANTPAQLAKVVSNMKNIPISSSTICRGLKKSGMKAVVKQKKPYLKAEHRRRRMKFATQYRNWTIEDWKRVIWSDETKINRLGSDGKNWAWKKPQEPLQDRLVQGTLKFGGGSLMIWGCMTWDGVGYAARINGTMNSQTYVDILEDDLLKTLDWYGKEVPEIVFQQDNDPKHTSKLAKTWFEEHNMEVLEWPAQSPDLNPIEHLWCHLKKKLAGYENPPKGIEELWERVQTEWEGIEPSMCQKLIESMPSRVEAVYRAKGGYTKY